jgi:hypothetical protein
MSGFANLIKTKNKVCKSSLYIFDNAGLLNVYYVDGLTWKENKIVKTEEYPSVDWK